MCAAVLYLVIYSCPTLCYPIDCSPLGSSVHGDSPGKNTGVGCYDLLQGIFPTQESNRGLPRCRRILYVWATSWSMSRSDKCVVNKKLIYFYSVFIKQSGMTQNLVKCVKYLTFLFLGYPHPLTAQFSNSTAKCHDMTPGTAHVWYIVNVQ